ncbi:MAG: hypothetical protein TREMPRED_003036 [Tremellales sp. Tagirdzhanova-0007]|nr:MAG: hypothetical protein TREMPRED_003036 [Tremellales sp. Tagirdzhanova-0007]
MRANSLAHADTLYSADCIEFCPFPGYENIFVCGTYQVLEPPSASVRDEKEGADDEDESGDDAEGSLRPRHTMRTGRLLLYRVGDDEASIQEVQRVDTPAILDAKWSPRLDDHSCPVLAVADADGHITLYTLNVEKYQLELQQSVQVGDPSTLCLSLDYHQFAPFVSSSCTQLDH